MPGRVVRGASVIVLLGAMAVTVWMIGAVVDLRGLLAGLAFWPLLPYVLLLIVASGRPTTPWGSVATLAAALAAGVVGLGAYYLAFVGATIPPNPLVLVVVPLAQMGAAALILGGAFALSRGRRSRGR